MPPKKTFPTGPAPSTAKQKKFKPPLMAPPPAPLSDHETDSQSVTLSQQGDEDMTTLGQILESMMKVSKDRRSRRRKEIEGAYHDRIAVAEEAARKWVEEVAIRKKRQQLATLTKLKALLARKRAIENDILTTLEALEDACEGFGEILRRNVGSFEGKSG